MFLIENSNIKEFRKNIAGVNRKVPTVNKKRIRYINFDNAASTPALIPVIKQSEDFLGWYGGVHRGTGYKSLVSSRVYDECHEIIGKFVKADLDKNAVIMVKNTTEAINKLSYRMNFLPGDVVITTLMEHHSNDLPWRKKAAVKYVEVDDKGLLDMTDLEKKLKQNYGRVRLLSVCGASNVTGHLNDIHRMAELAHEFKARIMVDAAQLIPHQIIDMKANNHPQHIDYLAFSGHKIYAPFGVGVLIGPRETFLEGEPEYVGGGTVSMVTSDQVVWGALPDREEAGSPNVMGAFALAQTINNLESIGMNNLSLYEEELTRYTINKLNKIPGINVYGSFPRVGVISFNIDGLIHSLVGAILCYEAGIGVRTGCFCAQPYVRRLICKDDTCQLPNYKDINMLPGMVRISLAAYNTYAEVNSLIHWLETIASNKAGFKKKYNYSARQQSFLPYGLDQRFFHTIRK